MGNTAIRSPEQDPLEQQLREQKAKTSALKGLNAQLLAQCEGLKKQTASLETKNTDLEKTLTELHEQVTLLELLHFGP
ncbi:MAG: hypothetical protein V3S41_05500, partial [Spirochaetia bacterium]